jgi:hypothetical protein
MKEPTTAVPQIYFLYSWLNAFSQYNVEAKKKEF